jgi:hypothetical protein
MPRIVAVLLGAVVVLLVAVQLALPPLAERRVEDRLERDGGSADVSLSAFPAVRLLFDDGDSLEVKGEGLGVDLERPKGELERIDGFDDVSIRITRFEAGPVQVRTFALSRKADEPAYQVAMDATTTPREVARYLGSEAGGALGGFLGDLASGSLPGGGNTEVPVELGAVVESRDGEVVTHEVIGSVAGIPAGPLLELVVEAVVREV